VLSDNNPAIPHASCALNKIRHAVTAADDLAVNRSVPVEVDTAHGLLTIMQPAYQSVELYNSMYFNDIYPVRGIFAGSSRLVLVRPWSDCTIKVHF
jgi:hypothetical protein